MSTGKSRVAAGLAALALGTALAGCGTPGAPQPPSLDLPTPVADLAAVRNGNQVALTWTMPLRNTDKLLLKGDIAVHVCRREAAGVCASAGDLQAAPGTQSSFRETLAGPLAAGAPRTLNYSVELKNRYGRSAGVSNIAVVLAGEAPAPVTGLSAAVRKSGVLLHWNAGARQEAIRLQRKLLSPQPAKGRAAGFEQRSEPIEQALFIDPDEGRALDKSIVFGNTYEYRAQRVARADVNGKTLELAGELSAPIRVEAQDVFPPAVPRGLVAVATAPSEAAESSPAVPASIDLNWQPNSEGDLAGYAVYRRESGAAWQRISPAQPIAGPAFHDGSVQPGHTYSYAVTALDRHGHESARSAEAHETVPAP